MVRFGLFAATLLLATFLAHDARADAGDRRDDFAAPKVNEGAIPETKKGSNPQKALVVVGLAATSADDYNERIGLSFRRYDSVAKEFTKSGEYGTGGEHFYVSRETRKGLMHMLGDKIDPKVPVYVTAEAEPGEWILIALLNGAARQARTTHLATKHYPYKAADSIGPMISVRAGEVVYVGNFLLDVSRFPANLVQISRDEAAAKAFLAESPELQAKLITRPLIPKKSR